MRDPRRPVAIRLMRDHNRYREPLFVRVNDYTALIQRGVTVEVPYYVARHIEEMTAQDEATALLVTELTSAFARRPL